MAAIPPIILVLDISALSAASPNEWREFSRVGTCCIPQAVYEEMRLLFDRSPDPDLERIAKAFNRFYAGSGWKISDAHAQHSLLKPASGQGITRRARISLSVGRCAYALAQSFSNSLVVLVSSDRSLLQKVYDIPSINLCGIAVDSLLQWSRAGQRPIAISQKLQQFRLAHGIQPPQSSLPPVRSAAPKPVSAASKPKITPMHDRVTSPDWLPDFLSLVLAAGFVAVAGYILWLLLNSSDLRQFLPGGQPGQLPPSSQILRE